MLYTVVGMCGVLYTVVGVCGVLYTGVGVCGVLYTVVGVCGVLYTVVGVWRVLYTVVGVDTESQSLSLPPLPCTTATFSGFLVNQASTSSQKGSISS